VGINRILSGGSPDLRVGVLLTQVQLPLAEVETDAGGYDEESHEVGGIGAAAGKVQVSGCDNVHTDTAAPQPAKATIELRRSRACMLLSACLAYQAPQTNRDASALPLGAAQ